ncbi:C-type mannose receptor 2-like, partial [Silurus meridionalis]
TLILFPTGIAPFVSPVSNNRYYVVQEQKTWSDAQAYCQATHTDLAIIKTNDDLIQIQDEANRQQFISKAWVGLYNDNSWRWSLGNKSLGNMKIWAPGQPNNNGGKQNCGVIIPAGWDDRNCTDMNPFVCFDETKNGSDRYIYNSKKITWIEAQSYCRQYYTDLASTSNETEYTLIHDMATPLQFYTWIGLFRNPWKWIDQTSLSLVPWKTGKPDNFQLKENCGFLYQNQLDDTLCSDLKPFFCYDGIVPFVSSVSYFRYYVVKDKKTWSDAQAYCQATYTDLAIIKTNDNLIQIQDEANRQQFISKAWIGVYNDVNSWRWSLGNKPLGNMTIWAPGQPSNNRGMQSCGAIAPQGWDDRYCTDMTPFVCFDETKNGSDRYIYNSKNTTWIEAQSYCRQYYTDLASTSDETEYTLIHDMATPLQIHTWIGLFRDSWKWIDETPLSLVPWKIGKPDNFQRNESCAILYQNQLEDSLCSVLRPFFCYDGEQNFFFLMYYVVKEKKTWSDAQAYCQATYTDLAIIKTNDNLIQIQDEANRQQFISKAWIGVYNDVNSWHWSLGNKPLGNMKIWAPGQPNNYNGNQNCGVIVPQGWDDRYCTIMYPFVCFDETKNSSDKYIYNSKNTTWIEAQSYCRQNYTDLASIRDVTEYKLIHDMATPLQFYTWIGLFRNPWKWIDETPLSLVPWKTGNPDNFYINENCAFLYQNHLEDALCSDLKPFFCYDGEQNFFLMYYVVKEQKTWSDAQAYCQATHTDLAMIKTNDDLIQIQDEANRQQFISKAWVGVYNDNSWRWSLGNKPLENMKIWAPGQPNNNGGKQNCGVIIPAGWDDRDCTDMNPFVCFDETKNGSDRYIYNSKKITWIEAQSYCRQYYTDLASTRDETEYTLIHDIATPLQFYTWIGLIRNPWKWIDQTSLSLIPW